MLGAIGYRLKFRTWRPYYVSNVILSGVTWAGIGALVGLCYIDTANARYFRGADNGYRANLLRDWTKIAELKDQAELLRRTFREGQRVYRQQISNYLDESSSRDSEGNPTWTINTKAINEADPAEVQRVTHVLEDIEYCENFWKEMRKAEENLPDIPDLVSTQEQSQSFIGKVNPLPSYSLLYTSCSSKISRLSVSCVFITSRQTIFIVLSILFSMTGICGRT